MGVGIDVPKGKFLTCIPELSRIYGCIIWELCLQRDIQELCLLVCNPELLYIWQKGNEGGIFFQCLWHQKNFSGISIGNGNSNDSVSL